MNVFLTLGVVTVIEKNQNNCILKNVEHEIKKENIFAGYLCITFNHFNNFIYRGEAVAYFDRAQKSLKSTLDPIKSCNVLSKSNAKEAINFANDVIEGKYNIAKRENEFIYHDKVPDDLPDLKGQTLVKGIGFEVNEENGGKDIFSKLIPLEAHTASSLYSEEKAKVLRELCTKIENKVCRFLTATFSTRS